jgi:hypothetical protein
MDEQELQVIESYLMTRGDYGDFQVAVQRLRTGRKEKVLFCMAGMLAVFISLLGRFQFSSGSYTNLAYALLFVMGCGFCCFYDVYLPGLVYRRACRYFDRHWKNMLASAAVFDYTGICFITEKGCVKLPYNGLRRVYEDQRVILLEGRELCFLPKRILTMEEYERVRGILKRALKEKYVQEGVC